MGDCNSDESTPEGTSGPDSDPPREAAAPEKNTPKRRCCQRDGKGCSVFNPLLLYATSYFAATSFFLVSCNLKLFTDLGFPATGNLLREEYTHSAESRMVALIAMWGTHFARRFGETLFRIKFQKDDITVLWSSINLALWSLCYYFTFGFWIGWSVNYHNGYLTPLNYLFVPGIIVYVAGELINLRSHTWRKSPISKLYYFQESITWLGFTLASFTLAAWIFLLSRVSMIFIVWMCQRCKRLQFEICNVLNW